MLSGVKFIPRDQIDQDERDFVENRKKSDDNDGKRKKKMKSSGYNSSSDDEDVGKIEKGRRRKGKWYSSEEYSSESMNDDESEGALDKDRKKSRKGGKNKKSSKSRKHNERDIYSSSGSEDVDRKGSGRAQKKKDRKRHGEDDVDDPSDDNVGLESIKNSDISRKEMGLDWMLKPEEKIGGNPTLTNDNQLEEPPSAEITRVNPKELNPYLKDNGTGYPDDTDGKRAGGDQLFASSLVGDGGASWRLKALKRAKEQAAREGKNLEEIVEERWASVGQLAVSAASNLAAPSRAHLHAIKNRKRGVSDESQNVAGGSIGRNGEKKSDREYLKDVSVRHPEMRAPKVHGSLSWGREKRGKTSNEDSHLIAAVVSTLNKFQNDGSFMSTFHGQESIDSDTKEKANMTQEMVTTQIEKPDLSKSVNTEGLSANQLAAKAIQLRLKGKHEEAEKIMQEIEHMKEKKGVGETPGIVQKHGSTSRYASRGISTRGKEENADKHLAKTIIQNKQYSLHNQADDEYDFGDGPSKKSRKKGKGDANNVSERNNLGRRLLTQQERCLFCFENPKRPKHLVVSIANFTYLMLPQRQQVVPGHCCILTVQHGASTRSVDDNVWEEIRNFKKCLIMMFAKQEKELVFLETVVDLAKQRRHCLLECIPLPQEVAKEAPLYYKKAIDEAEDEWSQHNAKKLIDTSVKGLRSSIPKDFPYFHVEFGLNKGFVHVIDDETQFNTTLGLNVIRGMLRLPEEDMYRRGKYESVEAQKEAVRRFAQEWEPFDWTKQLD